MKTPLKERNARKRAQLSANEQVRKRAQKKQKERKRAQKNASS